MQQSYHMQFVTADTSASDRIGGSPNHQPLSPVIDEYGQQLAFIAQFYSHPKRLPLGNSVLCIQIYQRFPVDDPKPTIVCLPHTANLNYANEVRTNPRIRPVSVHWMEVEEPDQLPPMEEWGPCHESATRSKARGLTIHAIPNGFEFMLQLAEEPDGLNLGGYSIVVSRASDGTYLSQLD